MGNISLAELRMMLRMDCKKDRTDYLKYLENNKIDVTIYCKNLCGMNNKEASRAYSTLLNDEIDDRSNNRGRPFTNKWKRFVLPYRLSGDAIRF